MLEALLSSKCIDFLALSNGCQGLFLSGQNGQEVKLTAHLHLVSRSRTRGTIPPIPQYVFMVGCLVKHRDNFNFCLTFIPV